MNPLSRIRGVLPRRGAPAIGPPDMPEPSRNHAAARVTRGGIWLLVAGCAVAASLGLVLARANRALTTELRQRQQRAAALAADAATIVQLRQCPRQATDAGLPKADLLARVSRAMTAAQLQPESLTSTLPQPTRRLPNSAYAEVLHRLTFEDVGLEPLVTFCQQLTADNAELRIAALQLRPIDRSEHWSAEVSVAYWIVAAR